MSKIIIVTFFRSYNYGSGLQSYALKKSLEEMGHSVSFLGHFRLTQYALLHPSIGYARVRYLMGNKRRREFFMPSPYSPNEERTIRLDSYYADNYEIVDITSVPQWRRIVQDETVFVAGSDIIWNPACGYPASHFLDFAITSGLPCFSYATSIGAKTLPRKYHEAYRRTIGKYINVGVREDAAARLLEPIIGRSITKVLDPTLLLERDRWDEFSFKSNISTNTLPDAFILCYFVMEDRRYWEYVSKVRDKTHLQVVILPMHESDELQPYTVIPDGTPYEFVWLIKHAQIVLTDSFHACCLSLQYEKEFYLLRRARRDEDDKYSNLLERYNLSKRIVFDESRFERIPASFSDYFKNKLIEDRDHSIIFIRETFENIEQ